MYVRLTVALPADASGLGAAPAANTTGVITRENEVEAPPTPLPGLWQVLRSARIQSPRCSSAVALRNATGAVERVAPPRSWLSRPRWRLLSRWP